MISSLESLPDLFARLRQADPLNASILRAWQARLTQADDAELTEVLRTMAALTDLGYREEHLLAALWPVLTPRAPRLTPETLALLAKLYERWGTNLAGGGELLRVLAMSGQTAAIGAMIEQLVAAPPPQAEQAVAPLVPLFRLKKLPVEVVFPRLLDGLAEPALAPAILDLANYAVRGGHVSQHPAHARGKQLAALLAGVVAQLKTLEGRPPSEEAELTAAAQQVQDGITLAVCLCDALGLIGDSTAIAPLEAALELKHRRLRCEAAAALARLGDERSAELLAQMAAEPLVRLRAIRYAEELNLEDRLDPRFTTPAALAEAQLTCWFAEPGQFGFPPTSCELLDTRTLYWPGYAEPRECYLFRFVYQQPGGEYGGIAIAGPLTMAQATDVVDWPVEDLYALFAGWHVDHPEVEYRPFEAFEPEHRDSVERFAAELADQGFEEIIPRLWGGYFGNELLVAEARQGRIEGLALIDNEGRAEFEPRRSGPRPFGPAELFHRYAGRRLLAQFNNA